MRGKMKFQNCKSTVPIIKYFLTNGQEGLGIVDTGSESTLFDSKAVLDNKECFTKELTAQKINLVGVQDSKQVDVVRVETMIWLNQETMFPVEGLVSDLSSLSEHFSLVSGKDVHISALFGSDTLSNLGAEITFKNNTVSFDLNDFPGK